MIFPKGMNNFEHNWITHTHTQYFVNKVNLKLSVCYKGTKSDQRLKANGIRAIIKFAVFMTIRSWLVFHWLWMIGLCLDFWVWMVICIQGVSDDLVNSFSSQGSQAHQGHGSGHCCQLKVKIFPVGLQKASGAENLTCFC